MATQHTETERKYEGAGLPQRLDDLPGVEAVRQAAAQDLDALYYDTPDLRLLRRGITLRRRSGGSDDGWHLKLPLDPDSRQENRLPATADANGSPSDEVPPPYARRLAAYVRGAELHPVAHLRTHRARRLLQDDRGETVAQVTEDRVSARPLAPPPEADAYAGPAATAPPPPGAARGSAAADGEWTEIEVELERGGADLLERIDSTLVGAGLTRSPWPSKLARALGRVPSPADRPAGVQRSGAKGSAGDAVMAGYRDRLGALLDLDAAVRGGEEDSVHRMRVTVRRLRSLLKAHRRLFDRARAEPLAEQLRRLGRLLGEARDQEVLGAQLVADLDAVPGPMRQDALRGRITERYARTYRHAWQRAVAELDSPWYYALLDDLEDFAADPPLRRRAERKAVAHLADTLRREQKRTRRRLDAALGTEPGTARDVALHSARKAAKRARYTAEDAGPAPSRRADRRVRRFARRMKRLHKVMGTHQDSVVVRRVLITLGSEDATTARHGFAFGVLHERQRQNAEAAERRLPRLRRRAGRRKLTRLR
ncbi:CYTH and CHAD domain-containing protein [Kitasatospora sp. NPDC054939]